MGTALCHWSGQWMSRQAQLPNIQTCHYKMICVSAGKTTEWSLKQDWSHAAPFLLSSFAAAIFRCSNRFLPKYVPTIRTSKRECTWNMATVSTFVNFSPIMILPGVSSRVWEAELVSGLTATSSVESATWHYHNIMSRTSLCTSYNNYSVVLLVPLLTINSVWWINNYVTTKSIAYSYDMKLFVREVR